MAQVAGGWAGLAGGGGCWGFGLRGGGWLWGLPAGVSACGGGCWGWGGWLLGLGFQLAGVAALAWGVWLLGLAGVSVSAGFGSGTGRVFGWLGWRG